MLCRPLVYFGVCLIARAMWASVVRRTPAHRLPWVGAVALVPALGFLTLYLTNRRLGAVTETGPHCAVWWHALRPVHGVLYLLTAVYAFRQQTEWAYVPLAIDVCVGLVAGLCRL